ncbi:MAG: SPFH domain-containing protein [Bacillota bacterium]|nr:SPFH domain-containing protein [Bacillota bacterium]
MNDINKVQYEEKIIKGGNGMAMLILSIVMILGSGISFIAGIGMLASWYYPPGIGAVLILLSFLLLVASILIWAGLKIVKPNEALVLTLFGKYYGTIKDGNFAFVNPFVSAVNPTVENVAVEAIDTLTSKNGKSKKTGDNSKGKKISLKSITLDNGKQKINDQMGNPIEIGIVVIWRVVNTAKAVFNVDNYMEYVSIQADSALRNIVRLYPYDIVTDDNDSTDERSLRGSSQEVAERLKKEIQEKVEVAGLEIVEARITHLAYAPEIAAAMLQRQQASAIIDARKMIVDGAVGMVEMALSKLAENQIVDLDEERKAAMVSNLLVVLCGSKDAQPIVNSGTIY